MKAQLIFQKDNSHKFWNINVEGNTHTVHYGRVGTAGQSKTKEFTDEAAALKNANKLVASKLKKGYKEASTEPSESTPTPILASSPVPPISVKKINVVRNRATFADKPIKELVGPLISNHAVKIVCEFGDEVKMVERLDRLSKLPNVAEMDTLVIGPWEDAGESGSVVSNVEKLIELKNAFSGLKHLFIGDMDSEDCEMSWIQQTDYSNFYQHFPALETFGIRGGEGLILGKINLPNLRHLVIETGGLRSDIIFDIAKSNLTNLEHLEIWLGTDEYGCTVDVEDLKRILNGDYPKLRYLGLKNFHQADELAQILKGTAALKKIEILDLSMGTLTDKGAEALLNTDELITLKHINCRFHFISDEWQAKLKNKYAAQNINLTDANRADEYGEVYYYVQIGE